MDSFLKSEIFFFITSIAVIVLTALFGVLFYYLIKTIRDIKYITQKAKSEADNVVKDIADLREGVKQQGQNLKNLLNFFGRKKTSTKKNKENEND